jgi:hypothetical protein
VKYSLLGKNDHRNLSQFPIVSFRKYDRAIWSGAKLLISAFFFLIRGLLTFFMATQRTFPDGRISVRHKINRKLCRSRNPLSQALRG